MPTHLAIRSDIFCWYRRIVDINGVDIYGLHRIVKMHLQTVSALEQFVYSTIVLWSVNKVIFYFGSNCIQHVSVLYYCYRYSDLQNLCFLYSSRPSSKSDRRNVLYCSFHCYFNWSFINANMILLIYIYSYQLLTVPAFL